eukprot:TRINITY_DN344_c0_g1_i1.p1 TRINITY_DN344_c0_g1~~TRINITY_DN344_c0_g1_i1.p1  ORF type:complete len:330 (-),score=51.96 TRINITY_DN344_c0_g1_i1:57-1046(-)
MVRVILLLYLVSISTYTVLTSSLTLNETGSIAIELFQEMEEKSVAERNVEMFASLAAQWDDEKMVAVNKRSVEAIREVYTFNKDSTTLLDFACGTGLASHQLIPDCKQVIGVDITPEMVQVFNQKLSAQGIQKDQAQALCLNILDSNPTQQVKDLRGHFDVVICLHAFHHFEERVQTAQKLAEFLKSGGALIIVDIQQSHLRDDQYAMDNSQIQIDGVTYGQPSSHSQSQSHSHGHNHQHEHNHGHNHGHNHQHGHNHGHNHQHNHGSNEHLDRHGKSIVEKLTQEEMKQVLDNAGLKDVLIKESYTLTKQSQGSSVQIPFFIAKATKP